MKKKLICLFILLYHLTSFTEEGYSFQGTENVLDIACGSGKNSLEIAKLVRKGAVIGVDFSKTVIEEAKKKHLQGPSNLSFKCKEFAHLDFKNEFDVVTCFSPRQFLFDQPRLLKNMHAVLKAGGKIIVKIPTKLPVAMESALRALTTKEKWSDYFITFHPKWNFYKKEDYKKLLTESLFTVNSMKISPAEEIFPSIQAFKDFIKSWLPYFEAVPKNMEKEFLDELALSYTNILPLDAEGRVHFFVEKLEVVAQKI